MYEKFTIMIKVFEFQKLKYVTWIETEGVTI